MTFMVVLGHCAYWDVSTPFGGIYYQSELAKRNLSIYVGIRPTIIALCNFIYSFHMPAFIALSGALFFKGYQKGKWKGFSELLRAKAERLLLPCIFVWVFYNIPIKFISGYYEGVSILDAIIQIAFPYNVYLWYLEALFGCFVLTWLILHYCGVGIKSTGLVLILWMIGYAYNHFFSQYVLFGNPFKYLLWFYLGMFIDDIIRVVRKRLKNDKVLCLLLFLFWICTYLFLIILINDHVRLWKDTILPLEGTITIWVIATILEDLQALLKHSGVVKKISSYCYGVYLYAEPLNYLVLWAMTSLTGITFLASPVSSVVEFPLRGIGTVIISLAVTWLLKKSKFFIEAY